MQLALVVPPNAFFAAASDKGIGDDPATLHGAGFYNIEPLAQIDAVRTVCFEKNAVAAVKVHASFLVIDIHRYQLAIV